ncbi:MAG: hypothetical protein R3335_15410, partial [Anaerolineales bacterium]|nr:hypothetical protein [Anaerolineales bacterium]
MEAESASILTILLASVLVLILPGFVWLTWLAPQRKDLASRLAQAIGLSLALNALLAEAAFLLGLSPDTGVLALFYLVLGALALTSSALALRKIYYQRQVVRRQLEGNILDAPPQTAWWQSPIFISLMVILGLAALIFWRFYQARDLPLPPWVDPLHHVLIVRLILENQGLPATFDPYMPVPFYYHFGFHINAALFSLFSRLPVEQAVLVLGQILNAAVALSVYRLGIALWSDWRRAAIAGLMVGFVSQMPAYYLTWGRYTLLAGLVVLPLAMAASVELFRFGWRRERVARLAVLTAGLLLTHYIAAVILAVFLLIGLGYSFFARRYFEPEAGWMGAWFGVIGGAAAGFLLAAPWLVRVWTIADAYTSVVTVPLDASLDNVYFGGYLPYLLFLLGPTRNYVLLGLAAAGLVAGSWRRRSIPLLLWTVALLLLSSPWGPRVDPIRPDHVVIILFLPMALLIADGFVVIWDWLAMRGYGRPAGIATGLVVL